MARYIKAVECAEIISKKLNIPLGDLVDIFAEIPTADVVPKSEFERLEKLFNDMTQEAKGYLNRLYGIRADVAREIFEEIDGITELFAKGLIEELEMYDKIAELKKKYTESCTDCGHFVGCEKANWIRGCEEHTERNK